MSNYDAYGTKFKVGTAQVESTPLVGTGDSGTVIEVTVTAAGMGSTPKTINVTIVTGDLPAELAKKCAIVLAADSDVSAMFRVHADGPTLVLTKLVAIANDGTLNIAYTGGGTTPDITSDDTTAGVVVATVAQVTNITGPGMTLNTADVTTLDSTNAWEESVGTFKVSGETTFDIVYDPADNTHDATDTAGLIYRMKNKVRSAFSIVFSDVAPTTWSFDGEVTGFEPSEPFDGALTASVTVKPTGSLILV